MGEVVFCADIPDPPISIKIYKKKYYLNANIFYAGVNPFTRMTIVNKCKEFLLPYFDNCPFLADPPYSSEITYCHHKHIDLDNKCYFWRKIIHDLITEKTIRKASSKKKPSKIPVIKLGKIKDDNTQYFVSSRDSFFLTRDSRMIVNIIKV